MSFRASFRALALTICLSVVASLTAAAQAGGDRSTIQSIIRDQIAAFTRGDAATAYGFASEGVRGLFPSPADFMAMVKGGYPALVGPRSVTFGDMLAGDDGVAQQVFVVDAAERSWIAVYLFQRDATGTWRITACVLKPDKGSAI